MLTKESAWRVRQASQYPNTAVKRSSLAQVAQGGEYQSVRISPPALAAITRHVVAVTALEAKRTEPSTTGRLTPLT